MQLKLFKFEDLSESAKLRAIKDYEDHEQNDRYNVGIDEDIYNALVEIHGENLMIGLGSEIECNFELDKNILDFIERLYRNYNKRISSNEFTEEQLIRKEYFFTEKGQMID